MKQDIIESFRKNFEELLEQRTKLENEIKESASKDISLLISENKFDASQKAIELLKLLLKQIHLELDFTDISEAINSYNHSIEKFKSESNNDYQVDKEIKSKEAFAKTFGNYTTKNTENKQEKQESEKDEKINFTQLKEQFSKYNFEMVHSERNNVEFLKKRKKYWLTIVDGDLSKEDYVSLLEEKCGKKNIGFICDDETQIEELKRFTEEWKDSSPAHKTKFLHVNFTSKKRIEEENDELFQTLSY